MKILTFTALFPNAEAPSHGVFVENRLRQLVATGRIESRVVAPIPWFPSRHPRFGRFARHARVPTRETRHGIQVVYPRYLSSPLIAMYSAPLAMALGARSAIASLIAEGFDFDAIDAHYFYPDGVAAALLARWFDRPLVITARGSDVTQLASHVVPRAMIQWAAREAASLITVSRSLKDELIALGVEPAKIDVLRNGVDLTTFAPIDPPAARAQLSLLPGARVIASVGHLIPRKGHELVIDALAGLPGATLLIAGSGPDEASLRSQVTALGLAGRVRFLGQLPHDRLPLVYSASDVLVLASSNEGWANVLLEAMACGTPVVATDVGGSREVIGAPESGCLLARRDAAAVTTAVAELLRTPPDRQATRRYAERFSWLDTTLGQLRTFDAVAALAAPAPRGTGMCSTPR